MSATQRPTTSRAAVTLPGSDAVGGPYLTGAPLDVELVDGEAFSIVDLDAAHPAVEYDLLPGARVVLRGTAREVDGEEVPFVYRFNAADPALRHGTIAMPKSIQAAFQQGQFDADAQEGRGDADAATVSENPQPPRATPKYAEVRLTTDKQRARRADLIATGKAWRDYASLPWCKRVFHRRPAAIQLR